MIEKRTFKNGQNKPRPYVDYHTYILSAEWKLKRQEIIRRAKNICERCHNARVGDIHHLTYEHLGNEPLEDLQGLCKPCHMFISGKGPDPLLKRVPIEEWLERDAWERQFVKPKIIGPLEEPKNRLHPDFYQKTFVQSFSEQADFDFWHHLPPDNVPEELKEKWIEIALNKKLVCQTNIRV
jgi:hypothetical protein